MNRMVTAVLLIAGIFNTAYAQNSEPFASPANQAARAKELKQGIKTFRMELNYNSKGDEGKPFYRLILSVPRVFPPLPPAGGRTTPRIDPYCLPVQITEEQAAKIIDYAAANWFLVPKLVDKRIKPVRPGYTLEIGKFSKDLGWGVNMLHRLEELRGVLDGKAAKKMDVLLQRMSALRPKWEKEDAAQPHLGAAVPPTR